MCFLWDPLDFRAHVWAILHPFITSLFSNHSVYIYLLFWYFYAECDSRINYRSHAIKITSNRVRTKGNRQFKDQGLWWYFCKYRKLTFTRVVHPLVRATPDPLSPWFFTTCWCLVLWASSSFPVRVQRMPLSFYLREIPNLMLPNAFLSSSSSFLPVFIKIFIRSYISTALKSYKKLSSLPFTHLSSSRLKITQKPSAKYPPKPSQIPFGIHKTSSIFVIFMEG